MSFQRRSTSSVTRSSRTSTTPRDVRRRTVSGQNTRAKSVTYSNNTQKLVRSSNELSSNIQVYVRCRSRNQREIDEKSSVVISTMGPNGKEVMLSNSTNSGSLSYPKKTYIFDQVFGAESDQNLVFDITTKNYIQEMMDGYNCTVFAYGQTGTGKTYTMSGDINILGDVESQDKILLGEHAGIIPRVLVDLFQRLSNETNNDFSVKISFLELYNEKLTDLLSNGNSDDETIRIFDNHNNTNNTNHHNNNINNNHNSNNISNSVSNGSGNKHYGLTNSNSSSTQGMKSNNNNINNSNNNSHDPNNISSNHHSKVNSNKNVSNSAIIVKGMEEIYIKSAYEGLQLLTEGSLKRKVASTKCNDLSSRSHTIFTITTHITKIDPISGEQYVKIGKLNLVDLAGSENINRSGAENIRAQEAGLINKSLLTLGRVINALVDYSQHVPYRESKLTRLLQDSLGGRTKTCIIATISPAKISSEETVSTLEYATRAKSIKNTPQVNQSMSKDVCLNEYVHEIERLRHELRTSRQKDGIYVSQDQYDLFESNEILLQEQKMRIHNMEEQTNRFKQEYVKQTAISKDLELKLKETESTLQGIQEQKFSLINVFEDYEKSNNLFIKEVQDIHSINSNILNNITKERNEYFDESKDFMKQICKAKDITLEQEKKLRSVVGDIMLYNNTFKDVIEGVYSELQTNSTVLTDNVSTHIATIDFENISKLLLNMKDSIHTQLVLLRKEKSNMVSDPYKVHRVILESCFQQVTKSLNDCSEILQKECNTISNNVVNDLNVLDTKIVDDTNITVGIIIKQRQQLIELESKLQEEQKNTTHLNEKLDILTKYFEEYVTKEKSNLYDILSDTFQTFRLKQTELDKLFLNKAKTEIISLGNRNNKTMKESIKNIKEVSIHSFDSINETVTQNQSHISALLKESSNNVPDQISKLPIKKSVQRILDTVTAACNEDSSKNLHNLLKELNENKYQDDVNIANNIQQMVTSLAELVKSDNQKNQIAFNDIQNDIKQLDEFVTNDFNSNITQIAKTQTDIIKKHSDHISVVAETLNKNSQFSIEKDLQQYDSHPQVVKMSKLPDFKKPSNYDLYDNMKTEKNVDVTHIDGISLDNISPVHISLSNIKYNPSTPVPVPDHPLPQSKVLMPRSVNTKNIRSNTVSTSIKQSSSRVTSPLKPNNLKRRFTLEPLDSDISAAESKENKAPLDSIFEIKKVHLDPNMPHLKNTK
ncbi:similar to Saccharomyces cerevisiae YBL063W KIP1 Kinesin-related motor protein required for mitotic spindle assembly, chromosome segregation, and 2 micron plasmid partitioning [Maudiozyma saulgeensis]|uniref:Similar to Saccharomyces cerevisiae YBL063W KIP1 Kinesin-related motor protein required for mitotic spindle assembly, chromosome segregation, and 2 micron plasmid partitioning n=1 Tax=Maudiozyma saulgeensis TaxID=1789683 RepID=A0A1X7R595_9SACH|nr:similar to Saccharomyces cerevisiae YBL063W KIP1 Kinesin-related motor protein required for mitotic spindle assembly, chromosome segregation, and 2 micron plasmid partitioning [Kazachstania saulgeensis]